MELNEFQMGMLGFPALLILIFLRVPIAAALFVVGLIGTYIVDGDTRLMNSQLKTFTYGQLTDYSLSMRGREQARLSRSDGQRYVVRNGDSLWTIGRKFGVSSSAIARWNGMAPRDTLRVGRELVIKSKKVSATSIAPSGPSGTQRRVAYRVRNGDSLSTISSRFRVTVSQLVSWNKLDRAKYLQPGQSLVPPQGCGRRRASNGR